MPVKFLSLWHQVLALGLGLETCILLWPWPSGSSIWPWNSSP